MLRKKVTAKPFEVVLSFCKVLLLCLAFVHIQA